MRFASVLILAVAAPVWAQTAKPDFTGAYELDRAASQGPGGGAPAARTLTVEHDEPRLKYIYQDRNRTQEFSLTTDGTDQVRDEPKGEARMSARWDGNVLEIRSFRKAQDGELTTTERWSAGPGGTVTIQTRAAIKPGQGVTAHDRESRLVFRKKR